MASAKPKSAFQATPKALPKTLHERVGLDLLARIKAGEWPIGAALPSEAVLASDAGVSRHTLRHTLQTLESRGFIERRQGAAARVISTTEPRVFSQDFNTLQDILRYPRNTYRENQTEGYVAVDAALQGILKSPIGASWYHIGAVRKDTLSKLALAWTDIYILNKFAKVTKLKNHASEMVFEQIETHFGVSIDKAELEMTSAALSPTHAKALGAKAGSPSLVIVRRYFDPAGDPFEVTVTHHPEHRFTFSMALKGLTKPVH